MTAVDFKDRVLRSIAAVAALIAASLVGVPAASAALLAPTVTAVTVPAGGVRGGTHTVLDGRNFAGVTKVLFGSVPGTHIQVLASYKLSVYSPAHTAGAVHIIVMTDHGTSANVLADEFRYIAPPTVKTVMNMRSGQRASVTGGPFVRVSRVSIAGQSVPFSLVNSGLITATVPQLPSSGAVPVRITDAYGVSPTYSAPVAHPASLGVSVSSVAWNDIKLSLWGNSDRDAMPKTWDAIQIERTYLPPSGLGSTVVLTDLSPTSTSYDDATVQPNSAYRYAAVPMLGGVRESPYSTSGQVSTPDVPAPTGFKASPANPAPSIDLAWDAIPASPNTPYVVIRRVTGSVPPTSPTDGIAVATLPSAQTDFEDTSALSGGTTYSYALFVQDAGGRFSSAANTSAVAPTPPAGLNWDAPTFPIPVSGAPGPIRCPSDSFCMLMGDSSYQTWNSGTWSTPQTMPAGASGQGGTACAGVDFCMLIGGHGYEVYTGQAWTTAVPLTALDSLDHVNSVACPTPSSCIAVTFLGATLLWDGTAWTKGPPFGRSGVGYGDAVMCVSVSLCLTQGGDQWNGTSWSEAEPAAGGAGDVELACTSTTFCIKTDSIGRMTEFNNGSWSPMISPWSSNKDNQINLSCSSPTFCISVGEGLGDTTDVSTFNGTSWSTPTTLHAHVVNPSVACLPGPTCFLVDTQLPHPNGQITTYTGGAWGSTTIVTPANGFQGVSCVQGGACHAVDYQGNIRTYDGTAWSPPTPVDPASGAAAISCATDSFCAIVDDTGGAAIETGAVWGARQLVASGAWFYSISCASDNSCMAVTQNQDAYQYLNGTWTKTPPGAGYNTVACGSASYCVSGDRWWNGAEWQALPSSAEQWPSTADCVGPRTCVIASGASYQLGATSPQKPLAGWLTNGTWATAPVAIGPTADTTPGISAGPMGCLTATRCVAEVGVDTTTFTPTSAGVGPEAVFGDRGAFVDDLPTLSCSGPTLCVNAQGGAVSVGRG